MARPLLSIVIATYRRLVRLQRCIEHIRRNVDVDHEVVVVDGGSDDGTPEWLAAQRDVRFSVESPRKGCRSAYDVGFRAAAGEFVTWLNDDAYPLPGAADRAIHFLQSDLARDVGMAAFYHNHQQPWNELHGVDDGEHRFGILHVRGFPYANFGLLRASLLAGVGYLDPGYRFCAWDPDLSLKVHREAGLLVVGVPDARVFHEELIDERKRDDADSIRTQDNERLFRKWNLPAKGEFPDPRPEYSRTATGLGLVTAISSQSRDRKGAVGTDVEAAWTNRECFDAPARPLAYGRGSD
ncbi:MAG: glycosyltransferase [Phycisphaerae bacterium]